MTDTPQTLPLTIKHRFTDQVLFTASPKAKTVKDALMEAVQAGANLAGANLARANLADANLTDANLAGAYLADANLAGAYLARANLAGANLARANLADANLAGVNLADADLADANLADAKGAGLAVAKTRILPEGDLIGYKKCVGGVIVKLRIPEAAKRSHAFGRKCRAEFAEVVAVYGGNNQMARSSYDADFVYRLGEIVKSTRPFSDKWEEECAPGIHFFITRAEAEAY